MGGAKTIDVVDRLFEAVHDLHREHVVEILGTPVLFRRRFHLAIHAGQRPHPIIATDQDLRLSEILDGALQERLGHVGVHQQGLFRATGGDVLNLGVHSNSQGLVEIGG